VEHHESFRLEAAGNARCRRAGEGFAHERFRARDFLLEKLFEGGGPVFRWHSHALSSARDCRVGEKNRKAHIQRLWRGLIKLLFSSNYSRRSHALRHMQSVQQQPCMRQIALETASNIVLRG
jgi:hypothetical protein